VVGRRLSASIELTVDEWLRATTRTPGRVLYDVTGNYDMADLTIVCTLSPEALQTRRLGLLSNLLRRAEG
jgi:hypothetical protein